MGLANNGKLLELEETMDEGSASFIGGFQQRLFFLLQDLRAHEPKMPELVGKMITAANPQACNAKSGAQVMSWGCRDLDHGRNL